MKLRFRVGILEVERWVTVDNSNSSIIFEWKIIIQFNIMINDIIIIKYISQIIKRILY